MKAALGVRRVVPFRVAVVLLDLGAVCFLAAVVLPVLLAVADLVVLPAVADLVDRLAVAEVVPFLRAVVVLAPVVERVVLDRAAPVLLVVRFVALVGIGLAPGKEGVNSRAALLYRAVPRGTIHNRFLLQTLHIFSVVSAEKLRGMRPNPAQSPEFLWTAPTTGLGGSP